MQLLKWRRDREPRKTLTGGSPLARQRGPDTDAFNDIVARKQYFDRVVVEHQAGTFLRNRFELLENEAVQGFRSVRRQVPIHRPV